jgi:hypothetical protein
LILHLQRAIGNQSVQRLLQAKPAGPEAVPNPSASGRSGHDFPWTPVHAEISVNVQSKPAVNTSGDIYEEKAKRIPEQVMQMSPPPLQRTYPYTGGWTGYQAVPPGQEQGRLQTKRGESGNFEPAGTQPIVHGMSRLPGRSLEPSARSLLDLRFRQNLSEAQIHTDDRTATLSRSPERIGTQPNNSGTGKTINVNHVVIYLNDSYIDFHTTEGTFRYHVDYTGLIPGEYSAGAVVEGNNVDFTLNGHLGEFEFSYQIEPGQPNPSTFFANQASVLFNITNEEAPEFTAPEEREEEEADPSTTYLSLEEALRRCESGDLPGVKVFPYRGTRFGAAPIMAHRDGDHIVVKQPVYVLGNADFGSQTRTLPTETFIGGVRLQPNEIVRLHTYEPRWYHLNITGSTAGDIENEFCVTGEQMLDIARESTNRTVLNVGLTAVDAALFFVPVGRVAEFLGRPILNVAGRSTRNLAAAIMLGMREAGPTAFAGIASRTGTVVVEQQAVSQVGGRAITQTVAYATVEFSEQTMTRATTAAATEGLAEVGGERLAAEAVSRTVMVTVVDAVGGRSVSTLTTPTGDAALDAMIDQAFSQTFDTATTPGAGPAAGQGVVPVAPEIAAGFTQAQVQGFRRFVGKRFSDADIQVLQQLWDDAARAGDGATLNASNSRRLFDLHRDRFWARVRANDTARALFEDAGCRFTGGAPHFMLNGQQITMTIDHIIERQTAPQLALTASNLRISFSRENSVVLRLLHELDPFQ